MGADPIGMPVIHYCGRREVKYARGPWDAIVSINDPDEPTPELPDSAQVLRLEFYDLDQPFQGYPEPRLEHVQALLDLAEDHLTKDSRVLIHCHAGISRSAAAAIILAIALGVDADRAITQFVNKSYYGFPNGLLLQLAEQPLGVPGLKQRAHAAMPKLERTP